ncbi:hypothetical protein KE639_07346 [Streptomyces sp. V17-9]|nr:hypothetical protein KE639_00007 [Streptomyces sp. V17-9]QUW96076.1 hypothetical protein KE639_07346 [Streptomyces sp. V17-9]
MRPCKAGTLPPALVMPNGGDRDAGEQGQDAQDGVDDESDQQDDSGRARMQPLAETDAQAHPEGRKDESASAVVDIELRAATRSGAGQPPAPPASAVQARRPPVRHHHDECDKVLYEGGACTRDLIEQLGPPSAREDSY